MRLIVVAGSTQTAAIEGITAAGASPSLVAHTPAADAEVLVHGRPTRSAILPVSPSGCPTPAVVTHAAAGLTNTPVTVVDAGMATASGAPTVQLGRTPGADIRTGESVPGGRALFDAGRRYGRSVKDNTVVLGETIPGGTTTALAVRMALGLTVPASSSLRQNPLRKKQQICERALSAAGLNGSDADRDPIMVATRVGDPVLLALTGIAQGALEMGTEVILGGGTQLVTVIAMLRALGVTDRLLLTTTPYLLEDVPSLPAAMRAYDCDVRAADPAFDQPGAGPLGAYTAGVAKEGAGMGGSLWIAQQQQVITSVCPRARVVLQRMMAAADIDGGSGCE